MARDKKGKNRLCISTCLTPAHGRVVTLTLLNDMVAQNAQVTGLRHPQPIGRGFSVPETDDGTNDLAPCMVRARNPGPHPCGVDPLLRLPNSWLQCLCRRSNLPTISPPTEPALSLSSDSSDTELTPSGLPYLESITRPES